MDSGGYLRYHIGRRGFRVLNVSKSERRHEYDVLLEDGSTYGEAEETLAGSLGISEASFEAMKDYLELRPSGSKLTHDIIDRWGFGHRPRGDLGELCTIKRIVLSDGRSPGFRSPGYFASSKVSGGPDTFWEIDFHSIELHDLPSQVPVVDDEFEDVVALVTSSSSGSSSVPRLPKTFLLQRDAGVYARYLDALDEYCQLSSNLNRIIPIRCPGARPHSTRTQDLLIDSIPLFCVSPKEQCLRASIVNALWLVCGLSVAEEFLRTGPLPARSLGEGFDQLRQRIRHYHGKNFSPDSRSITWLGLQVCGVFLIHLQGRARGGGSIDHVVCFDAQRRLVLDPAEYHALRWTDDTLLACLGDQVEFRRIVDVKQLVLQDGLRHSTKRRHRKTSEQRREQGRRRKSARDSAGSR